MTSLLAQMSLLQLVNSALPVGAYSYSEALEFLIEDGVVQTASQLQSWLMCELERGTARLDGAVMLRSHRLAQTQAWEQVAAWNAGLSAMRETRELRLQSEQMGTALEDLLRSLVPDLSPALTAARTLPDGQTVPLNFAIAFGLAATHWQIEETAAVSGYLHSWVANLIGAGVKLIPLGQTAGQQALRALFPTIATATDWAIGATDDELETQGWGMSLASMQHETMYMRLFRS